MVGVPTGDRRRAAGRRPGHLPGPRRRRPVPGVGDAAVRAGQPVGRDDGSPHARHVAAARSRARAPAWWSRRPGPWCSGSAPTSRTSSRIVVAPGARARPATSLVEHAGRRRLPPRVPGRAPGRDRGAGLDRRRVPVDRRRARCASTCGATRSTGCASSRSTTSGPATTSSASRSSRAASCCPPTRCGPGPRRWWPPQPWGREQWERLADGETFDGMESWLPWLTDGEHVLFDLRRPTALVIAGRAPPLRATAPPTSSPRRSTWPRSLAGTWGRRHGELPRLHLRLRPAADPHRRPGLDHARPCPTAPTPTVVDRGAGPRPWATATRLVGQLRDLVATGYRIVVAADGAGSAERIDKLLRDHGVELHGRPTGSARPDRAGGRDRRRRAARAGRDPARR